MPAARTRRSRCALDGIPHPDLVVIEDIALSELLTLAPKHRARAVIDLHNIDSRTVVDRIHALRLWQAAAELARKRAQHRKGARFRQARGADGDQVWVCSWPIGPCCPHSALVGDVRVIANPIPTRPCSPCRLPLAI